MNLTFPVSSARYKKPYNVASLIQEAGLDNLLSANFFALFFDIRVSMKCQKLREL